MNYNKKILILIAGCCLTFTSCDNFLDIQPKGIVIPKTCEDYETLLNDAQLMKASESYPIYLTDDIFMLDDDDMTGGFNYMEFLENDMVIVNPLKVKRWITDELEASLLLYFTGRSRSSAAIIDQQKANTTNKESKSVEAMHRIKQSAKDMKLALLKGDMREFARILGQAWEDKKKMADAITNPVIEHAFEVATKAGAVAGKVSGAGGGGFCMFMVEPTKKKAVTDALKQLDGFVMPFQFTDGGAHGWKIYETDDISTMKY